MRPHIIGHYAEIFADHARSAGFLQDHAQILFAFAHVRLAVFKRVVIARNKMWGTPSRSLQHFLRVQWEEFIVPQRAPWKGIDPIKALDVIDPKQMKDASNCAHPFAPPLKIVRAHRTPAIERNSPVLPPFLRERVVFEMWLGRRAAEPIEDELIPARENVGAVITDTERNVAH